MEVHATMAYKQQVRSIFINLPVRELSVTRAFWSKLGFSFDEAYCDENAVCLVVMEGEFYAMLLREPFFQTFTTRPVADGSTTQVLMAIDVGSRERVLEIMALALDNGATHYLQAEDHGWMYYDRFMDPDGHQWEISFVDETAAPKT